ncbi:hypothetical protein T08_11494 [Trichinella sp. T8]|nr:hypothetical protein T08_11494 [Trichinella sp. T8]
MTSDSFFGQKYPTTSRFANNCWPNIYFNIRAKVDDQVRDGQFRNAILQLCTVGHCTMAIRTERCAVEIATPPDGYTLATRV